MFRRMNSPTLPRARRRALLWLGVSVYVGGILFAGLNVQGWESRNDVEWVTDGTGLEFGEHGLAYTDTFTTQDPDDQTERGFTIEIALRPSEEADRGFRFIAVVHGGDDSSQLLIAQWRQTIIVMNGDDYDYRRRSPRLTADISKGVAPRFLAVKSDARGSAVYLDGESVASRPDLALRLPTDSGPGRLVLGNSVYGNRPWSGRIAGFALHRTALDRGTLDDHLESWRLGNGFAGDSRAAAAIAYPLSEGTGRIAVDRSPRGVDLHFPREQTFIEPKLFDSSIDAGSNRRDIGLNLFGFIPFGFLMVALLANGTQPNRLSTLATALAIGFALSASIELVQAWIPSRTSSLLDLLLNVAGTGVGGGAFVAVAQPLRKWAGGRAFG